MPRVLLLPTAALLLGACTSGHQPRPSQPVSAPTTGSTIAAESTTSSTVASATSFTTSTNSAACHTSELHGGFRDFPNGAGGNDRFDVQLTNATTHPCSLLGYPGLGFLNDKRQAHNIPVVRGSAMLAKDPGPRLLMLQPGQTASASVGYTPNCNGQAALDEARTAYIELTPPGEKDFVLVPVTMTPGTFLAICGSHVSVTAMVGGPNGTATS